ncbi:MAG TPA: erythromycin esterase family protein, partial [Gammaproteobacteria bacterium]
DWDSPAEHRWVRPALRDSVEHLFRNTQLDRFFLPLRRMHDGGLRERTLERAIGVIYRPETERQSHYLQVSLAAQFDALFHLDTTTALQPLDPADIWNRREPPETWPSGM